MWIILPGLGCPPQDYAVLQQRLGAWVMDAWTVGLDASVDEVRTYAFLEIAELFDEAASREPVRILGHSMGGLLALEWAARYPEEVAEIVLADPTPPKDARVLAWMHLPSRMELVGEKLWGWLGTDAGAKIPGKILTPALPFLRKVMTSQGEHQPERLSRAERKRYFGSVDAGQSLIRQNCACERTQRRAFYALGGEAGADAGWLREIPITLLVASDDDPSTMFVREQLQLAQRLRVTPHFFPEATHLFPIATPEIVEPFLLRK